MTVRAREALLDADRLIGAPADLGRVPALVRRDAAVEAVGTGAVPTRTTTLRIADPASDRWRGWMALPIRPNVDRSRLKSTVSDTYSYYPSI